MQCGSVLEISHRVSHNLENGSLGSVWFGAVYFDLVDRSSRRI